MQNSHSFLINQLEKLLTTLALLPGKILEPNPAANPMLSPLRLKLTMRVAEQSLKYEKENFQ